MREKHSSAHGILPLEAKNKYNEHISSFKERKGNTIFLNKEKVLAQVDRKLYVLYSVKNKGFPVS